jgi:NAD(P)-dependent dehydrogenase (short-subunit alcohol dehydrogenase family)
MSDHSSRKRLPATAMEAVEGLDLGDRLYVVTGAYSGLGATTTRALLSAGAKVVVAGRNADSQAAFVAGLTSPGNAKATAIDQSKIDARHTLDLGSLASVRAFADHLNRTYDRIDGLINNAGVMNTPPGVTSDGFEIQMGTNVIGHFLLAKQVVDITRRQVWLSSRGHTLYGDPPGNHDLKKAPRINLGAIENVDLNAYDSWARYQQSKLGDILLAKEFAARYPKLKTCAVHPGVVRTNLSRHMSIGTMIRFILAGIMGNGAPIITPDQGARTQIWCAVMPESELVNGGYYADCKVEPAADAANNMDDARQLFDFCDRVTADFQN